MLRQVRRRGLGREELAFLPPVLAIQETPPHPLPRAILWALLALLALAVAAAWLGRVDVVVSAQGQVVPGARRQVVQPLEAGVVQAIRVRDGQRVRAGQVLLEMDATAEAAELARLREELLAARYEAARARAFLEALEDPAGGRPPRLVSLPGASPARHALEEASLAGAWRAFRARRAALAAEEAGREAELHQARAELARLEALAPLAREQAEGLARLVRGRWEARHRQLEAELRARDLEGRLEAQRLRVAALEAAASRARRERRAHQAEARRRELERLRQAEGRVRALGQALRRAERAVALRRLRAPVDGVVQELAVHTVGGVVTPAQPVLVVVPVEERLEVEAYVANRDVARIRPGQRAEIKVEAFPFTRHGTLPGRVVTVSRDAVRDERLGLAYAVRVALERDRLRGGGQVGPGMAVQVEIHAGRRRVLEYFLAPLLEHLDRSLREP